MSLTYTKPLVIGVTTPLLESIFLMLSMTFDISRSFRLSPVDDVPDEFPDVPEPVYPTPADVEDVPFSDRLFDDEVSLSDSLCLTYTS
jgi:hypothetical protein